MSTHPGRELLATYVRPEWPRAVLLGGLLFAGIALQLANPQLARSFVDQADAGAPFDRLWRLAAAFTVVALLTQAAMVAETSVATDLGWRTTNALRSDLTTHVLGLDESFHADHGAGELMERIDGDVGAIAGFFARFVVHVFGSLLFLTGVLVLLWREDRRIGAVLTAFAAAAVALLTRAGGFVASRSRDALVANAALSGYLEERLGGLVDIKANGADAHVSRRLDAHLDERVRTNRRSVLSGSLFTSGVALLLAAGGGVAVVLGLLRHQAGDLSLGALFLVFRYTAMLQVPLSMLARHMSSFQQATGAMVRVGELLRIRSALADGPGTSLGSGPAAVELDHVRFAYATETVLHDMTLRLAPGEVLGLLGRTGSGKTTVARLLFRLYDPAAGAVRLDGVDVRDAHLVDVRARVGLVTQDVQLFDGTLRENVALFDATIEDERLHSAFDLLGLGSWLADLPDGLDTRLGSAGRGLSAGEAQLVALARVFLRDPGLVVLDEASSRLDPVTERLLERAVGRLLVGRTGIVIAHRLATVERADRIAILDDGHLVEEGRRDDLTADPGSHFSVLLRTGIEEVLA